MKRSWWNMVIDAGSLVVFMTMISTGLILKFVLPPGSGRIEKLLHGGGWRERAIDTYMGLSRHEWGEVHFYISIAFLCLLIVHLTLHWNWIRSVTFGSANAPVPLRRKVITIGIIVFIIFAIIFPWIGPKETLSKTDFLKMRGMDSGQGGIHAIR